jgi:hypothetical protein
MIFGAAIASVLTLGLAGLPALHSNSAPVTPTAPITQDSRELWVRIASDLIQTVPAEILLGSPKSNADLDARLLEARLDRGLFQRTAVAIRAETACELDDEEQRTMAATFEDFPLPDGFEPAGQSSSSPQREPSSQEAHDLVVELRARLMTSHETKQP